MGDRSIIEVQKSKIMMHRFLYVVFFLQRILLQFASDDIILSNTIVILSFIAGCELIEEVFKALNYFNKVRVLRIVRFVQCLLTSLMLLFLQGSENSEIMIISLLILFLVDYLMTMEIVEKGKVVVYIALVSAPVIFIVLTKMTISSSNHWMFLFFDILMLILVLATEAYAFVSFMLQLDKKVINKQHEFEQIVEKNENILNMQQKLKNTNMQLNIQKLDLQRANKQIKEANEEMVAQAEILHYIALSFEVPKISNQITDAIMQVKKLGFCAVYIKKDVYLNKHANYVVKTNIGQLQSKIKDNMENIYLEMTENNKSEAIYHDNLKNEFPFLKDFNINSMYLKVLGLDDETYGLFMIGDDHSNLFMSNMSFYDAIIAQYDIAISNAKIYSEMQQMARKDGLTGINNRIYFSELFKKEVEKTVANSGYISVALFDIDKFKNVNDTYGHLAGDEVIKRIAAVAEACIYRYDGFVCRYGGEEFVAVLPGRKLEIAQPIIEELFEEICSQIVIYNEWQIHMSVSIGLTSYPEVCHDPEDLLKRADWCMYYAKEHGRHQINIDDGSIQRD